jgi:large subunit ribosomal protein L35
MSKPIYRYLAEKKWRQHKRLVLEQRITQLFVVPDLLPSLDIVADIDLGFGRKLVAPGAFVDSAVSEKMPRLNVQTFTPGEKLVTVVVVDADVPVPAKDSFAYRCHFIASNIKISPSETSIPLQRIAQEDAKIQLHVRLRYPGLHHGHTRVHHTIVLLCSFSSRRRAGRSTLFSLARLGGTTSIFGA